MRFLFIGLILIGCVAKHEAEKPAIDGDWIFVPNSDERGFDYLGLRFENDTLYTINEGWFKQEGKFAINGDTIIVEEFGDRINKSRRIKKLTKDSLILSGNNNDEKYYSRNLEFNDSLKLNELSILTGDCLGECPQFTLELFDNGLIHFTPIRHCKTTEKTQFMLDGKRKNRIDSLFKWTYLQKLDTSKVFSAFDDWGIQMKIIYNNGRSTEFKTTESQIPFRLRRIFGILINSLREQELIK